MPDADVMIVGGGPVGVGLAIDLGQRGVSCIVVERHREPQPIPKGQNLTQRTMEHFIAWGVADDIRRAAPLPFEQGIGGLTAYDTLLSDYHYDWYQRNLVGRFYFANNERLPQYDTERVLRARASSLANVEMMLGWSAEGFAQDDEGVRVDIAARENGARRTLTGHYVVGCDGSRSIVRESAGLTQTLAHHDMRMALLVFRSEELGRLLARYKGKSFFNVLAPELQGYWLFFGRVDSDATWFFHAPVPTDATADTFDFEAYLHRAIGAPFDCDLRHIGFWDLRFAVADAYQSGRAFIAGDAAHSHPPYGGFGINTGFEDARNLAWKIAATLQGWGGLRLLESYSRERQPVFASTARDFIAKFIERDGAFLRDFDPRRDKPAFERQWAARRDGATGEIDTFEPHYEGSPIVAGPRGGISSAKGEHCFAARAGHHLAPQPLSDGRNVFEALGEGFTLLAFGAAEADIAAFAKCAAGRGLPLTIVCDTRDGGREAYAARLVLVRPDQYVAFAADAAPDVDALLAQVAGW